MKLVIEIDMKGEAFEPEPGLEVSRILKDYSSRFENTDLSVFEMAKRNNDTFYLRDLNGNICGSVRVEE